MSDMLWGQNYFAGQISLMVCERKDTTVSKTLWSSFSYEATQSLCLWMVPGMEQLLVLCRQLPMHFPTELGALVFQGG